MAYSVYRGQERVVRESTHLSFHAQLLLLRCRLPQEAFRSKALPTRVPRIEKPPKKKKDLSLLILSLDPTLNLSPELIMMLSLEIFMV